MVSKFPDRSNVIYSEQQRKAQKRFSDAISFARTVIQNPGLRDTYRIKATLLGYRSTWNFAIAEYMSDQPLVVKRNKIKFDQSVLRKEMGLNIKIKLYKIVEAAKETLLIVPERLRIRYLNIDNVEYPWQACAS